MSYEMDSITQSQPNAVADTVPQTIVANIQSPRLNGIYTKHFSTFLKIGQIFEQQVDKKQRAKNIHNKSKLQGFHWAQVSTNDVNSCIG